MEKKKILVIGLGPSGGILSAYLASNGHSIYGVDVWKEHVDEIRENGLKIESPVPLHSRFKEVRMHVNDLYESAFDYVVIAVKTPNMPEVLAGLKTLPGEFEIIIAQNGIDNEEGAVYYFDRNRILRMALHFAGNMVGPGIIKLNFFQKPNRVGCICKGDCHGHADEFAAILTEAGLDTEPTDEIRRYTWKKGILNAILAPIAAVLGVTMADVMNLGGTRNIVESLIRESIEVAKADGFDYGEGFFDECVKFLLNAGHHKPSMLIDLENGNPTEIDYINGKIVEYAKKYSIPAPFNTTITGLVKAKEFYNIRRRDK
jgi:2-dehydropantoate 2-reductase